MKYYQIDLYNCPEFIEAENLEKAEEELIQNIALRELTKEEFEKLN